jgi:hypothetical protein
MQQYNYDRDTKEEYEHQKVGIGGEDYGPYQLGAFMETFYSIRQRNEVFCSLEF